MRLGELSVTGDMQRFGLSKKDAQVRDKRRVCLKIKAPPANAAR